MDAGVKRGPKKIEISSSSLVALKAELLNKQSQVQRVRTEGTTIVRRQPSKKKIVPSNAGVEARAKRDEEQKKEEEPTLERARLILEEKAKLYERLSRDKKLLDEDTISEEQSLFLVNFQQKVVDNTIKQKHTSNHSKTARESSSDDDSDGEKDYPAANPEEEWVDYVDTFGRTRRCLKKDLPTFQQQDLDLSKTPVSSSTASYGNFVASSEQVSNGETANISSLDEEARKRQRQLWEEEEEKNRQKSKVHYQDILYQEARQHGVGFYSFSKDEEERAKQMEELDKIRRQTEAARLQTAQTSTDKQSALEARLKKVRDRKRQKLGLPPLKEEPTKQQPTPEAEHEAVSEATPAADSSLKETEDNLRKTVARSLPQSVKVRPWDLGKEGVPKKPVMTQHSWVEKKREERKQEFAPPSAYLVESDTSRPRKFARQQEPVISEDSIISGLAFMKQMQFPIPPPLKKSEYDEDNDSNDDDLMPPGETEESTSSSSSQWRSVPPTRGAEIAPPPSMEYYNNSSSSKRGGSNQQRTNVFQSFSIGISNQRKTKDDSSTTERCKDFSQ